MARNPTPPPSDEKAVTPERAGRLYRLLRLLSESPQPRPVLLEHLKIDIRSFYRDLERLRGYGVAVEHHQGRYVLTESLATAAARLPFPDPRLSFQEAIQLATGRSPVHRKLKAQLDALVGDPEPRKPGSRRPRSTAP